MIPHGIIWRLIECYSCTVSVAMTINNDIIVVCCYYYCYPIIVIVIAIVAVVDEDDDDNNNNVWIVSLFTCTMLIIDEKCFFVLASLKQYTWEAVKLNLACVDKIK